DERLVYVNARLLDQLGYPSAELLLGRPLRDIIHPDDSDKVLRRLEQMRLTGKPVPVSEERFLRRNGEVVTLEVAKVPLIFDEEPAVVAIGRDVSERRHAEQRFRTAVESAPSGMVMSDENGEIVLVNRAIEAMFGYTAHELVDQPIEILVPTRVRSLHPELRAGFFAAPGARAMGAGRELYGRHKDGSEIPVEIGLNPIQNSEGTFVLCSVVDVSERKRAESALAMADRMTAVGTLAAGVAHGINNPLAYVKGNLLFAQAEIGDLLDRARAAQPGPATLGRLAEVRKALGEAEEGANRVRDLVTDLLTFSRHREEPRGTAQLTAVLESVLQMTANEIRHRARLAKSYEAVPAVVGEVSRLAHVFTNLIVNAAQSIPEGEAECNEIRVATWTDSEGWAVVEIRDTGCGITPDLQARIFEPFFTTKPIGSGTGLGLSIAHGIVSALGGGIDFESELGKGTAFRVRLPAWHGERGVAPAGACGHAGRMRLLLVDDDPLVLRAMRRQLEREHDVLAATSGQECLALLQHGEKFDAILCDLMMPVMTGMQLYDAMAQEFPRDAERMVFVTGGAFTERAQQFLERVPNPRVAKPIDADALRTAFAALTSTS
ncbi:MAG TPA: PAS domain S-box protein, partial [Myxococcota bacterium]|nr:PAS domain S-box protein [Myxococcota bacterium]